MADSFEIDQQQELNWCWAAVAATVSRYFLPDQALQQCKIAKAVLNTNCCPDPALACDKPARLEDALDKVNTLLPNSPKHQKQTGALPFNQIRKQIDSGRPVCARIQWIGELRAHFVMISGYSVSKSKQQWVDVADPYYGDSTVSYKHFAFAYLGVGTWSDTYLITQP